MLRTTILAASILALALTGTASADNHPQQERQALMEGVRDAAKVVGPMLRGDAAYDSAAVAESLDVWADAAARFGELFPEGSESGDETEAAPAIWEDRAGFDAALAEWSDAVDAAIAAKPATLEEAKPLLGAAFGSCKNCHDGYRVED